MSKRKKIVTGIVITIVVIAILLILEYLFLGNYEADAKAHEIIAKDGGNVKITKIDEGYFFDGPGEETAIIFYPGAKVEYVSYSVLMDKIAQSGKDCFLVQMPFNIAFFGENIADKIIEKYKYDNWYISGHSLGGMIACKYASKNAEKLNGIITLAAYPINDIDYKLKYISIYGNNDKIINIGNYEGAKEHWPTNSKEYVIEGGNHSNFANYGTQTGDGTASITSSMQQDRVVDIISMEL